MSGSPLHESWRVVLQEGSARAEIDLAQGARVASLVIDEVEVLWTQAGETARGSDPLSWGSYPMAPFAGRVGFGRYRSGDVVHQLQCNQPPHAIHGTVFDRQWEADVLDATTLACHTDLGEQWPFAGRCRQWFDLGERHLTMMLEVESLDEPFWAAIGWHPWFRTRLDTGESLELLASPELQAELDADGLPTGRWIEPQPRPWDDCFAQPQWPIQLVWGERLTLGIESDAEYVVIYDHQPHGWCVEPQTAPPNTGDLAGQMVEPGVTQRATMTWRW